MSLPTAAKRRHFDHKREQDQDEDDEEDNEVSEMIGGRDQHFSDDQAELNNVSVNAKIGHFERLLQHAAPQVGDNKPASGGNKCHYRNQHAHVDMLYEGQPDVGAQNGVELLNEDMVGDDDDAEYLGLDTIVEEDEEEDEVSARQADIKVHGVLRNNCDNYIPSDTQAGSAAAAARLPSIHIDSSRVNNGEIGAVGGFETDCASRDAGNRFETPSRPPAELTTVMGSSGGGDSCGVPGSKAHLCRQPPVDEQDQQQQQQQTSPTTTSENNDELTSSNNNNDNNNLFDTIGSASMERRQGRRASGASPESGDNLTNSSQSTSTTTTAATTSTTATSQEQTSCKRTDTSMNSAGEPKIQQHQQQAYQPLLLPSTNRLISEHQARQQQTLFRALAERQKLLDELGPDEREQQADLMSSCLNPAIWRRGSAQQNHKPSGNKRAQRKTAKRRREAAESGAGQQHRQQNHVQLSNYITLKLSPKEEGKAAAASSSSSSTSSSSSSKGVPLSAVDLSSVSDRMLDELLGHIASASSSSSKAGSLDSSDLSSLSGSGNDDDDGLRDDDDSSDSDRTSSSCSSSSFDGHADGSGRQSTRRSAPIRRHRRKCSYADGACVAQHALSGEHPAPSVIGVHDEADSSLVAAPPSADQQQQKLKQQAVRSAAASRKCREAYRKSRRGPDRSDEDDDYQDEDQDRRNQGDLVVSSAGAGSGSLTSQRAGGGCKPNGCSLSPASTRRQQNSSSTVASDNNSTDTGQWLARRARDPSASAADGRLAGGAHPSESPTTSDEPSSMSLLMGPPDVEHERPLQRDQHQSVEAILGRMLEALQEVGVQQQQQQRQGEEQEQLNDLLERGFLHLEQLLNCSLAPRSTAPLNQGRLSHSDSPGSQLGQQQPPPNHQHPHSQTQLSTTSASCGSPTISGSQATSTSVANQMMMPLGANHIMLSKDSDYGSDTQSADCFSHSTSSGASNSSPASAPQCAMRSSAIKLSSSSSSADPSQPHQVADQEQQQQEQQLVAGGHEQLKEMAEAPSNSDGALSPLAIELSFKLAESLRKLAQQQQQAAAARAHREQLSRAPAASGLDSNNECANGDEEDDQDCLQSESMTTRRQSATDTDCKLGEQQAPAIDDGAVTTQAPTPAPITTTTTTAPVRTRMKSVVMINSAASCSSSLASRPHSSQSQSSPSLSATVASGNMTPVDGGRSSALSGAMQQPAVPSQSTTPIQGDDTASVPQSQLSSQRQQFKTLVNLNSSSDSTATVGNASVVVAPSSDASTGPAQTIVKVVAPSRGVGALDRRPRSSFRSSSLRRRPSFSGSIGGGGGGGSGGREPGAPRPGSPVPRSALADTPLQQQSQAIDLHHAQPTTNSAQAAIQESSRAASQVMEFSSDQDASGQASTKVRQQRQLQRALILAQKYNYSPAKLAASKLGSELQLAAATAKDPSRQVQEATEAPNVDYSSSTLFYNNKGGGITSGQAPVNNVTGQVQLEISYFAKSGSLTVHLLQCSKLAPMAKRRTTSNPYVKLYLLPDRSKAGKRKSSIKRRQLDPKFNERFTFGPLQLADFDSRCLWLSVWHKDRGLGRNEFLGELLLPLSQVRTQLLTSDLCQSTPANWYRLQDRSQRGHLAQRQHEQQPLQTSATNWTKTNATGNSIDTDQARGQVQFSTSLTTKRVPQSNGHLSLMLAKPGESPPRSGSGQRQEKLGAPPRVQQQQAAELVARKLSEFEMKAARLTQQAQQRVSPSGAQQVSGPAALLLNSVARNKEAALAPGLTNGHHHHQQQQQQQQQYWQGTAAAAAEFKTMQVTLGASLHLNGEQAAAGAGSGGQLFVALKFVPESGDLLARRTAHMEGSLHVLIKEARNIAQSPHCASSSSTAAAGANGTQGQQQQQQQLPSPYCKCYLLDTFGQRVAKQKTSALKRTGSPRWDHECVFANLRLTQLTAQAIEILLLNRDSILVSTGDKCLGAIRLCKRLRDGTQVADTGTDNSDHSLGTNAGSAASASASWSSLHQSLNASMKSNKSTGSNASASSSGEDICTEREARLWTQMLARPNIWVYGELPLRQLRPLIAANSSVLE